MRRGPLLVAAALCALSAAVPCAAYQAFNIELSELAANAPLAIRFRPDDHGALRALRAVYAAREGLLWVVDGRPTPAALALLQRLQQAGIYGLEPQDYDADRLTALATGALRTGAALSAPSTVRSRDPTGKPEIDARRWATFDVDLSAAALKLVCDLHYGRVNPHAVGFDLGTPRADDLDLARELVTLATSVDIASGLAAIEPQFLHYRLLERALTGYRLLAVSDPAAAAKERKIELTLERWRWLPVFRTPPIIVNIPEFRLFAFRTTADRAADILQMDVIVGRAFPRTRTGPRTRAACRYRAPADPWACPCPVEAHAGISVPAGAGAPV